MMNSLRLCFVGLLCLSFVTGCADVDPAAPPVMDAMDSFEALRQEEMERKMDKLRAEAAARKTSEDSGNETVSTASVPAGIPTTGKFVVDFQSTAGPFTIEVDRSWAPIGADRFYKLVKDGFYDDAGFFRVIPGFMVQFGLAADPMKTKKWSKNIQDDPVVKSNLRGYVTFAKTRAPNSRSGQIFINYGDNSRLDQDGFAPFGRVTKGMASVEKINAEYREGPDQGALTARGNTYLKLSFPNLDYSTKATIVVDDLEASEDEGQ